MSAPEIRSSSNIFIDQMPVTSRTLIPNAVIRYTTNGDEPTASSPAAMKTLLVKGSTTVKARSFLYNKPVTETSTASFQKVVPGPAMNVSLHRRELIILFTKGSGQKSRNLIV